MSRFMGHVWWRFENTYVEKCAACGAERHRIAIGQRIWHYMIVDGRRAQPFPCAETAEGRATAAKLDRRSPLRAKQRGCQCVRKRRYATLEQAIIVKSAAEQERGITLRTYSCEYCGGFHLTHHSEPHGSLRLTGSSINRITLTSATMSGAPSGGSAMATP